MWDANIYLLNLKISCHDRKSKNSGKDGSKKRKTSMPCQICGLEFQSNKKLLIHMYIHADSHKALFTIFYLS